MDHYKFELTPLPYSYDTLEPYIDTQTMRVHHDAHMKAYVDNLNAALEKHPSLHRLTLSQLITNARYIPDANLRTKILRNAGGVYNHELYFSTLAPGKYDNRPVGALAEQLNSQYGSFENFKKAFTQAALDVFGSGYVWLVKAPGRRNLIIYPTANQETPLPVGYCPILPLDLWEHAYYLKHQNRRAEYVEAWWYVVNWDAAGKNYKKCR